MQLISVIEVLNTAFFAVTVLPIEAYYTYEMYSTHSKLQTRLLSPDTHQVQNSLRRDLQMSENSPYVLHALHCFMASNLLSLFSSLASYILASPSQCYWPHVSRPLAPVPAPNFCTPRSRRPHHWWMSIQLNPEDCPNGRSSGQASAERRREALAG